MADDDDEESETGIYENGHWIWDDKTEQLLFISHVPKVIETAVTSATGPRVPTGTIEFRDDIDVIEQLRFRKRYQRKGEPNVITVQDVKDLALFTAPIGLLTPVLINFLHLTATERFLRALVFYCQYYLQVADEMAHRNMQLQTKIRTPFCEVLEARFKDNLNDLRVLVAKEYCVMVNGAGDFRNFHHMGPTKKIRSLSVRDARLYEMFFRICVQIVWIALGRRSFNQLELEVNRIFKSDIFNSVEHMLQTNYINKMSKEEREVLFGPCVQTQQKLNTHSPLMNEIFCNRLLDYRLMGLGQIAQTNLTPRLQHILMVVGSPEEQLEEIGITCGIFGKKRNRFDTMLRPLELPTTKTDSNIWQSTTSQKSFSSRGSRGSKKSLKSFERPKVFNDIMLPEDETDETDQYRIPETFPDRPIRKRVRPYINIQRLRWLDRLARQATAAVKRK